MDWITDNLRWLLGGIIVLGAIVYGLGDLMRFRWRRVWAISSVSFAESIRRRVLWVTPLAMLGVIAVTQLSRPDDEMDVVRQVLKFSLFATGLLISMVMLIVAATNLPKEIETRVIYTVVSKPTTRLEIVLGKILGFARVSAALLAVMGLFTWGYAGIVSMRIQQRIGTVLADQGISTPLRSTFERYRDSGLLAAKILAGPRGLEILSRDLAQTPGRKWVYGSSEQELLVPFDLTMDDLIPAGQKSLDEGTFGIVLVVNDLIARTRDLTADEREFLADTPSTQPSTEPAPATQAAIAPATVPATTPATTAASTRPVRQPPLIAMELLDERGVILIDPKDINSGKPVSLPDGQPAMGAAGATVVPTAIIPLINRIGRDGTIRVFVRVVGITNGLELGAGAEPISLVVPSQHVPQDKWHVVHPARLKADDNEAAPRAIARGRSGTFGQQLKGGPEGHGAVAVYHFDAADVPPDARTVDFELRAGVERTGGENTGEGEIPTILDIMARNSASGAVSAKVAVEIESNRTIYFRLPAEVLRGGAFDILIRCTTPDQWPGLRGPDLGATASLQMVAGSEPFAWNLFKSLLILWMMSILIASVTFLCSTFLSWPIAIVCAMFLLMGQWMIQQVNLSDKGMARAVVRDLGLADDRSGKVVTEGIEGLTATISRVGTVLPDISRFSPIEDLERGVRIPADRLTDAAEMLLCFGGAALALSYIALRRKEVAP